MHELERYYKQIGIEERLIGGNMTYKPSPPAFLATADPNVFVNATRMLVANVGKASRFNSSEGTLR